MVPAMWRRERETLSGMLRMIASQSSSVISSTGLSPIIG